MKKSFSQFLVILVALAVTTVVTHFPTFLGDETSLRHMILSGEGFFILFLITLTVMLDLPRRWSDTKQWESILSGVGMFGVFVLLLTSITILLIDEKSPKFAHERAEWMIYAHAGLIIYIVFCYRFFWLKFRVKKGMMALLDKKVFYPGDVFTLWKSSHLSLLPEEIPISLHVLVTCTDGEFQLKIRTVFNMDIPTAQEKNIQGIDGAILVKEIETWITEELQNRARKFSFGQLLQQSWQSKLMFQGTPVSWAGKIQIQIV